MQFELRINKVICYFQQCLFKRSLSGKQWLSLVILTLGCLLQGLNVKNKEEVDQSLEESRPEELRSWWALIEASTAVFLILIQVTSTTITKRI